MTGRKTPLDISVRSSASMAGRAVVGSSLSARLAVIWKILNSDRRLGGLRSLLGYTCGGEGGGAMVLIDSGDSGSVACTIVGVDGASAVGVCNWEAGRVSEVSSYSACKAS